MAETTVIGCVSAVRDYHIYQEIWEASCGQTFPCLREEGNPFNPFTVSVVRAGNIIGHVQGNFPLLVHCSCGIAGLFSVLLRVADDIQEILSKEDLKCHVSLPLKERKSMW